MQGVNIFGREQGLEEVWILKWKRLALRPLAVSPTCLRVICGTEGKTSGFSKRF